MQEKPYALCRLTLADTQLLRSYLQRNKKKYHIILRNYQQDMKINKIKTLLALKKYHQRILLIFPKYL